MGEAAGLRWASWSAQRWVGDGAFCSRDLKQQGDFLCVLDCSNCEVRNFALTVAAQIHWRLILIYDAWPYYLAQLADPSLSEQSI